ncbi:hypothetical protein [Aliikangiella maris]|uniref:Uncharacterized protein n=2 Tax=Aliikangiella maris TaxID=3162458 RepID=A0ABV2BYB1_9GAMM
MDDALKDHPEIIESIKSEEWIYSGTYSFIDLQASDFNLAIKKIRSFIENINAPTEYQLYGIALWSDVLEPLFPKDFRYNEN